jgi:tetratricopeptide (TPR) repeat protein
MRTRAPIALRDAEQQALAVMTHAGIAKMLGAGATESGQPYFVMELVSGLPITAYCDMRRLSIVERVSLFIKVCHAVQHAHQKGVIHRDIKPSNILVAEESGQAIPKVIDFGVAKALGRPLTEQTLVTQVGSLVGTVAYMSPEQADGSGLDVDTRMDVYALGVTLYQLLVGRLPIDPIEIGMHQYLARLVSRDSSAPPLSVRLTVAEPELLATARERKTDPAHLRQQLRGDLDWISAKAIEPDRSARYDTVNALAADLERFLRHEPVSARPPSAPYRIRKFVRRHRAAVAATTIAILALVTSSVLATAGMLRASRAEQLAQAEAATAQQVTGFLVELFRLADPRAAQGRDMMARDLLDRGAQRVRAELAAQPELQTRVMTTIGSVYQRLGLYAESESLLVDALHVAERARGANTRAVAASLYELGTLNTDRGDFAAADSLFQRAVAIREARADAGDVAQTLFGVGRLRFVQRRLDEAESLFVRSLRGGGPTLPRPRSLPIRKC